jgi:hypothetical protein
MVFIFYIVSFGETEREKLMKDAKVNFNLKKKFQN